MKKTLPLLFTLLFALSAQSQNSLRLMTYNIKNANGMDDVCDFQRIADVINHIHPEVVALQELDSMTHRSGQKYVLGEIAGRTQMHAYFAPAIDYDGGKYGIGLGIVIALLFVANLLVGSVAIPVSDVFHILLGDEGGKASWRFIVWEARLPQAMTALLCGSALAVCGLMLQTAFKNPLAGPSILGINSGASLGVAFVMLLFGGSISAGTFSLSGFFSVLAGAFVGAMLIMGLILFFSTLLKSNVMLLITGIMIGYIASSAIALLNFFATAEGVQSYMIWGLGNFGGVSLQQMPAFLLFLSVFYL